MDIYYIRLPISEACEMILLNEKKNNVAGPNPETTSVNDKNLAKVRFKWLNESRFYFNNQCVSSLVTCSYIEKIFRKLEAEKGLVINENLQDNSFKVSSKVIMR